MATLMVHLVVTSGTGAVATAGATVMVVSRSRQHQRQPPAALHRRRVASASRSYGNTLLKRRWVATRIAAGHHNRDGI